MKTKDLKKLSTHGLMFLALLICGGIPTFAQTPAPRANGRIAFTSNRDGNREIYVMDQDGTNQVRLTSNSVVDDHPTWSPDGTKIAFVSETTAGSRAIFIMNADGTGRTPITPVSYVDRYEQWPYVIWTDFYSMDWSPDGTQLVFQDNYDLVIVNSDGSNRHAITDASSYDFEPAWSPDGSKILFSRLASDQLFFGRLSTVNVDGSNVQFLNGWQGQAYAPQWAPSGNQILYVIEYTDSDPTSVINISNADGSDPKLFEGRDDIYEYQYRNKPSWSPDGLKILFDNLVYENGYPGDLEIYVKNIDGTGLIQLTNTNGWNFNPSWQPVASASCPNPIDCDDFFVAQHYRDFLNREPDTPGLNHWIGEITECNDVTKREPGESFELCTERKRANTSAAFFLSPEFQNTGSFVLRVYWGTLGKLLNAQCPGVPNGLAGHCRPRYSEYINDMATITQEIVSNDHLDPARINANKHAFVESFVTRPEFRAVYDGLNNTQYVDKLFETTGITPSSTDRQELINGLTNGAETRASVAYKIVDGTNTITDGAVQFQTPYGQQFYNQEFDTAFVMMEYLGYLRRNPDQEGYDFWLAKMRRYGNWVDAQMVLAFIKSPEYRSRF